MQCGVALYNELGKYPDRSQASQQIYVVEYTVVGDDCHGLQSHMLDKSWVAVKYERLEREQEEDSRIIESLEEH